MQQADFTGFGVAMVTPFDSSGAVDYVGLEKLVNHMIDGGVDYLVVQGTTGESATLNSQEKNRVLEFVKEINAGRKPIVLGLGGNNTAAIQHRLEEVGLSVDGILSVSPYYNKPTQRGIVAHYQAIANSTKLPIILYNVPGRTSSNMLPDTTLEIARTCENVVAVKEASGSIEQIMQVIARAPKDFLVISGDDAITLPILAAGGHGLISVIGNAFPAHTKALVDYSMQGNMVEARTMHYRLSEMIPMLFAEGNPAGVKEVLKELGVCGNNVRLPLAKVSEELAHELAAKTRQISAAAVA